MYELLKFKEMKEQRIIAFIGFYESLILALNLENYIFTGIMILQAIFWIIRYSYLVLRK